MNTSQSIAAMTIEELQERCLQLEQQNAELTAKLNWFMEQFRLSKKRQFGVSSERTEPLQQQLMLFNEAEVAARPRQRNQPWRRSPTSAAKGAPAGR